ncbi:hypothetical protein [Arthrobacter sp. 2MCAF14]|uniref:hypothetical protein n=1 Tax=Arthrobacter sp. 2MCAF14 TaxID=3232982 RepID=UPI003F8DC8C4
MSTATLEQNEAIVKMRKNKQETWVVFGPSSLVVEGQVTVTLKSGATTVKTVTGVGNVYDAGGEEHRYGYLEPQVSAPATSRASAAAVPAGAHDFMPDDFTPDEALPADLDDEIAWED